MDYKLVVILLVLCVIIIMMYKEITNLRDDMDYNFKSIKDEYESNTITLTNKINTELNHCVTKIKTINLDNMQQIKKINTLNYQPIIPNHFTEDEDSDVRTDINYLSETNQNMSLSTEKKMAIFQPNDNINKKEKKEKSDYYVSESDNINKTDRSSNFKENEEIVNPEDINNNDTEFEYSIEFPIYENVNNEEIIDDESVNHIEKSSAILTNNETQFDEDDNYDNDDNINMEEVEVPTLFKADLRESFSEYISNESTNGKQLIDNEDDESDNSFSDLRDEISPIVVSDVKSNHSVESYNSVRSRDIAMIDIIEDDDRCEMKMDINQILKSRNNKQELLNKISEDIRDRLSYDISSDHISTQSDENFDDNYVNTDKENKEQNKETKTETETETDIDVTNIVKSTSADKLNNKKIKSEQKNKSIKILSNVSDQLEIDKDETTFSDEVSKYLESEYTGEITIGSKVNVQLKKETESTYTEDSSFQNMDILDLDKSSEYTVKLLKKMAKNLSVPTTKKVKGKWKPLNKKELYKNIKDYLKKK
jgi:hypothetical protein